HLQEGDTIKLGAPVGTLTLNPATGRNLLLVAGGTGLSPIKAILEHVTRLPVPPWVSLFWGAREPAGLYDLAALRGWASRYSWLTVIPALSDVPDQDLATAGTVSEIMRRYGRWDGYEAYVCGPPAMVGDVVGTLRGSGFNDTRIHLEQFASTVAPPQRFTS
ncbi:MAG: flavohemoprotein, partial [Nonomuraea sp.]|nr:flavohemoprotein [Nonomuraea sp.]